MGKTKRICLLAVLALGAMAVAQEAKNSPSPPRTGSYRLDFTVKELEDSKVLNTRNYSMLLMADTPGRDYFGDLRAGTRVPISTEKGTTYMDVGVSFRGRLTESEDNTALLNMSFEISSLALPEGATSPGVNPLVRQMRSNFSTVLSLGKPMLLTSVDDPNSKHRFQVEVTAAKLR